MADPATHIVLRYFLTLLMVAGSVAACGVADRDPAAAPATTAPSPVAVVEPTRSGVSILAAVLERYEPGYEFTSDVDVGEVRAVSVDGRRVGAASEMRITSGDGIIDYLLSDQAQWFRTDGGTWDLVTEDAIIDSPLESLSAPISVSIADEHEATVELHATYPASTFDVGADLTVTLIVDAGRLISATYRTTVDGVEATVLTSFRDLVDATPITSPTHS